MRCAWLITASWAVFVMSGAALAQQALLGPRELFEAPAPLLDPQGNPIFTGKALASPYAADFDGDGCNDLLIGGHVDMDDMQGGIWLARNVAGNAQPRFDWKNAWQVQLDDGQACTLDCGCKSAGHVPVQAVDWNADGWMDLVYTDTYRRAYVLINRKVSRDKPVFHRLKYFDFENVSHGMYAGGGDWTGDGIRDFLHMPHGGMYYKVLAGTSPDGKGLRFSDGPHQNAQVLKIDGVKARDCAWAWNFSGTCKPGQIEYVGIADAESRDIDFFRIDNGVSRKVGPIARFDGAQPKLTACDLNADGCMDVLYSGGVFDKPEVTKVYVLYGKVRNVPSTRPAARIGARGS